MFRNQFFREEIDKEMYQERSALQIEGDEEVLNKIKEVSRRCRQVIFEKYKTKTAATKPQLEDTHRLFFLFH